MEMIPYCIGVVFFSMYVSMQTLSIYAGDSGRLVAAAYTWSVAHPPGYPLYTGLGAVIVHAISYSTVAWRMGLLSSLPMALSIVFLWKTVRLLTRSTPSATVTSVIYGLLYPVWLYAIVPEVFGLYALFSILILYVFLLFTETKEKKYLYWLAFISGLSLTHHHLIILTLFPIALVLWVRRSVYVGMVRKTWKAALLLFVLGLLVYLYAPIASSYVPPFDWEHPASAEGFFRLVTRASFGTFKATYAAGQSFLDRGFNLLTFFQYVWKDFFWVGIGLSVLGLWFLWKYKRSVFLFFSLSVGLFIFFFFYAGFPVNSGFILGTLERFFIVPYQVLCILMGLGIAYGISVLRSFWHTRKNHSTIPFWLIETLVLCLIAVSFIRPFRINYRNLSVLRNDKTLEHLADDILASVPEGGILSLSDDTSTFAVDYAYYVQKKRQDIRYLSFAMLQYPYYRKWVQKYYPDVIVPEIRGSIPYPAYFSEFLKRNAVDHPIIGEKTDENVPEFWIPRGLLVMYYPQISDMPSRETILGKNMELWDSFQDPLNGSLGTYRHMMLSDVLRYYAQKRLIFALSYLLSGQEEQGRDQVEQAFRLSPKQQELYVPFITLLIENKKCEDALLTLEKTESGILDPRKAVTLYHSIYQMCPDLRSPLSDKEREYQEFRKKYGKPIE